MILYPGTGETLRRWLFSHLLFLCSNSRVTKTGSAGLSFFCSGAIRNAVAHRQIVWRQVIIKLTSWQISCRPGDFSGVLAIFWASWRNIVPSWRAGEVSWRKTGSAGTLMMRPANNMHEAGGFWGRPARQLKIKYRQDGHISRQDARISRQDGKKCGRKG